MATTSNINSLNSTLRITGLGGSGLDTDSIVKQLMAVEKAPLDKLNQSKQLDEWKQDAYRNITNLLRDFKDTYFNTAKPTSNMMSQSNFKKYTAASSDSSYVTVSGNANSSAGSHTVSIISVASAGAAVSSSGVTKALQGGSVSDYNLSGKTVQITLDGVTREITLDNYDTASIVSNNNKTGLQDLLDNAFGKGKITVAFDATSQKITFDTAGGASRVTLAGGTALASLGFTAGASNRLDINQSLGALQGMFAKGLDFNTAGQISFKINSSTFTFNTSTSLSNMMSTINSDANANVNMKYDETIDRFVITSKQLGYGDNVIIDPTVQQGNFFGPAGAAGINTGSAITKQGTDASATIDGQLVTRSSNSFTLNGVTYNLLKANSDPDTQSQTVSLNLDTDSIFNSIKGFVDKYNDVISQINTKLGEKYDRDYPPLTDDQKSQMKDADITTWETKAKTGLLQNDSMLQNIVYNMRQALSDFVSDASDGSKLTLSSIGITTGDYQDEGKLVIDEDKLRAAIQSNPDGVSNLFDKESSIDYYTSNLSPDNKKQRYNEEGLAGRISDILDDNIRTTGGKGLLLQKAGLPGDTTEFTSTIYEEITGYNTDITDLTARLKDKEDAYYAKFAAMEQYLSQMNAQSSWLSQQFGSSSQG